MEKFKSTSSLFSKIKEDFSSYDSAGLIDSGRFHTDVKYILSYLGIKWYIEKEGFLNVNNFKVKLPDDFKILEFAYKCQSTKLPEVTGGMVLRRKEYSAYPLLDELDWHSTKECTTKGCDYPPNHIFNTYEEIIVDCGDQFYQYSKPTLLKIGNINTKKCCTTDCLNFKSTSQDTITIQNNHLYANFEQGAVYISYYAFPLDEETGLPLIPDNPIIEKCIEDYIKYNLIKVLLTNKDSDVANLLGLYKQDYKDSLRDAIVQTKTPSFQSLVENIRRNRKSLNIYYQLTNG